MTSHSHKGFFIGFVFGLISGLLLGYWLCNRGQTSITTTKITVIDTVKYYQPKPYQPNIDKDYRVNLPKFLFAPADTVVNVVVDSVELSFPVERIEYRDSTYYAIVSGAVVGNRRPTLDYIETYNRTTTSEVVLHPRKIRPYVGASVGIFGTWSVGVGGGLLVKDHHAVGAEYERTQTDNNIKLKYSYLF